MTRTLVSREEQWPFERSSLEDLSRRLLTLRCTVRGTMENCAAAEVARSSVRKYRGIEIGWKTTVAHRRAEELRLI